MTRIRKPAPAIRARLRPILPTPCREALIQRREIRPLGPDGGMGELGQDGSEGTIPLAGFARALLARTFIIPWGHPGPGSQAWRGLKARHINPNLRHNHFRTTLIDPRNGVQEFDSPGKGERRRDRARRDPAHGQKLGLFSWGGLIPICVL